MSKISKEELKELQESQGKLNAIKHDLGLLSNQGFNLNIMMNDENQKQNKYKESLEEKYGKINIDLKDGSYQLIPEKDEENK